MRVLVADDDDAILLALELLLRREKIAFALARSPREVQQALDGGARFDAVLLDLNYERDTTSGTEGFSLLDAIRRTHPHLPVVVMTGWASIDGAVQAMRRGAADYLPKPWDNARLVALLRDLAGPTRTRLAAEEVQRAGREMPVDAGFASAAMKQIAATITQVAFSDVPVLVTGEHGTGKEIVARLVHAESGRRGEFVAVNAGALPDGTFESELFGHVRGAFTDAKSDREGSFARANGGTLFLDEVANMPLAQQAKLLRVLQEKTFQPVGASASRTSSARIVSATNADIDALAAEGRFRPDLLFRLNTIHLALPPLRARPEEIPPLVARFIAREAERYGLALPRVDDGVMPPLTRHDWPGNVRELEHVIQRAVLLSAASGVLSSAHLGLRASATPAPREVSPGTLRETEREAILRTLERFPGDRASAAKSLGLSRSAFYRRLAQLGIRPPR